MDSGNLKEELKDRFGDRITIESKSPRRLYLQTDPDNLSPVSKFIFEQKNGRLATVSSVDSLSHFELLYHFCLDPSGFITTLKVPVEKEGPKVESLAESVPASMWIEREIHDLMGIEFKDHPGLERLLKPDSMPDSVYPLQKGFDPEEMEE